MAPISLPWQRRLPWTRDVELPAALVAALGPDEQVQAMAQLIGGEVLAASRFGLWLVAGDVAVRWNWERVSKARLAARKLVVIAAEQIGVTPAGIVMVQDLPPREFELAGTTGLTDAVHTRVRRSVAASRYLPWPGAGGWVVLRRVPGQDGLTKQVRLDPGSDPAAPGFLAAVAQTAQDLEDQLLGE